jgi:hypothetical protein
VPLSERRREETVPNPERVEQDPEEGNRHSTFSDELLEQPWPDEVEQRGNLSIRSPNERDRGPWEIEDIGTPVPNRPRHATGGESRAGDVDPSLRCGAEIVATHVEAFVEAQDVDFVVRGNPPEYIPHPISGPVRDVPTIREWRGGYGEHSTAAHFVRASLARSFRRATSVRLEPLM